MEFLFYGGKQLYLDTSSIFVIDAFLKMKQFKNFGSLYFSTIIYASFMTLIPRRGEG